MQGQPFTNKGSSRSAAGSGETTGAAHEQQVAQARLQLGDLLAHRPLAHAQLVGSQG